MTVGLLILMFVSVLLSAAALWGLLKLGERVADIDRFLHQRGLRMCYRDAEDLRKRFTRKEGLE